MARTGTAASRQARVTPGAGAASPQGARVRGGGGFARLAAIGALVLIAIAILVLLLSAAATRQPLQAALRDRRPAGQGQPGPDRRRPGRQRRRRQADRQRPGAGRHLRRPPAPRGHLRDHPRDLPLGDRQPLRLDPARARTTQPELGNDATITQVDTTSPGRPRPALQHPPRARSARPSGTSSRAPPPSTPARAPRPTRPTST